MHPPIQTSASRKLSVEFPYTPLSSRLNLQAQGKKRVLISSLSRPPFREQNSARALDPLNIDRNLGNDRYQPDYLKLPSSNNSLMMKSVTKPSGSDVKKNLNGHQQLHRTQSEIQIKSEAGNPRVLRKGSTFESTNTFETIATRPNQSGNRKPMRHHSTMATHRSRTESSGDGIPARKRSQPNMTQPRKLSTLPTMKEARKLSEGQPRTNRTTTTTGALPTDNEDCEEEPNLEDELDPEEKERISLWLDEVEDADAITEQIIEEEKPRCIDKSIHIVYQGD